MPRDFTWLNPGPSGRPLEPQRVSTIYYTAASLDGFTADESHSLDWLLQFGEPEEGYFVDLRYRVPRN